MSESSSAANKVTPSAHPPLLTRSLVCLQETISTVWFESPLRVIEPPGLYHLPQTAVQRHSVCFASHLLLAAPRSEFASTLLMIGRSRDCVTYRRPPPPKKVSRDRGANELQPACICSISKKKKSFPPFNYMSWRWVLGLHLKQDLMDKQTLVLELNWTIHLKTVYGGGGMVDFSSLFQRRGINQKQIHKKGKGCIRGACIIMQHDSMQINVFSDSNCLQANAGI